MTDDGDDEDLDAEAGIDAEAARWLMQLDEASLGDQMRLRGEFSRWRDADPRHAAAFARISATWDSIGDHAETPEVTAFRMEAREEYARLRQIQAHSEIRRWAIKGGAGVATAAAIAATYLFLWPAGPQILSTGIGERRTVELEDHSRVEIDADSTISVAFTPQERLIHVLRGQAYFEVAKHQTRPFVVESHERSVVATGTAFDVEALPRGLHVVLVEGRVLVRDAASANAAVLAKLEPGDSLTTEIGTPQRLEHRSNLLALLAWRTGHLIFDDAPLADAVDRMGHYAPQKVSVDSSLASLRISGVFAAGDMSGMLGAVEAYYPVAARRENDGGITLVRR